MTPEEQRQLAKRVADAAALVKLVCGVVNNATRLVMLRGLEHARQLSAYNRNPKLRQLLKHADKEWYDYEHHLIYAREYRMFDVKHMVDRVRRRFGDISDREYYEFWASIGSEAYTQTSPLVTSLWNKYRLSLISHGIGEPELVAWLMTTSSALQISTGIHSATLRQTIEEYDVPIDMAHKAFDQFSLSRVQDAWDRAVYLAEPGCNYTLNEVERHNIDMGIDQIMEGWRSSKLMHESTMSSVADYGEVFATEGFQKKTLTEIKKIQQQNEADHDGRQ